VTYRPRLEQPVLRQMPGLPGDAFDLLVRTRARICDDPDDAGLVRVYGLVWIG
jgi:hypothetical protein